MAKIVRITNAGESDLKAIAEMMSMRYTDFGVPTRLVHAAIKSHRERLEAIREKGRRGNRKWMPLT